MKNTGITRKIDDMGRVVLPIELRRNLNIDEGDALEIIAQKAVEYGTILKPTTGRYYYWPDDGREWCHCPKCKGLTSSDQATIVENAMVAALRKHLDPAATLSHIAKDTAHHLIRISCNAAERNVFYASNAAPHKNT